MILYTYRSRLNRSRSTGTPHHWNMLVVNAETPLHMHRLKAMLDKAIQPHQIHAYPIGLHGIGIMILLFMD